MKWIDSTDLENWAQRRDSQGSLPLVIRRLIRATTNNIKSISFPCGDSIVYSGWDGRLESLEETEYIPKGFSVLEISTEKNIKQKAEGDYQKRKQNPLDYNPSETVFIFVTPRIWTGKEDWLKEKREEKFWKDIRVYDARDLEEWLEQVPAVGAWLSRHIGKYPGNVLSLEDWWNEWSNVTNPPLIPELVIGGREEERKKIEKWLNENPSLLQVQAFTDDEAIAFLVATILTLPENEKEYFLSRSLVVLDQNSFRHIVTTSRSGLLLIPEFEEIETAISYSNIHHIFIPLDPDNTTSKEKIVLPHIGREEFVSSLEKMGISKEHAERYSKDTARILSVLKGQLSPASNQPEWAQPENARDLIPVLLVGKWDENKQGDKEIISEIAKLPYDKYIATLKKWYYHSYPPILKVGKIWRLTSHIDAFFTISPFLTSDDLENFRNTTLKVLREINPILELEPKKRWMASIYGKIPKYSKEIKEGIAETLILIAVFGDKVNSGRGLDLSCTSSVWIDGLIRELLNNADWKLWHSLEDVLPLIAEASPLSFLDAVENSLSQKQPPIMGMFSETEDTFTSHSAHPSLLWALEGLAWDSTLLGRVTLVLGKLARLDPGGKLANRPINSLRSIFLLWLPQTSATLERRLKVLDELIKIEPEIGWSLLINLLPRSHDVGSFNYKPRWRQFSERDEYKVTIKEHLESISGIVEMIIQNVGTNGKRWSEFIDKFPNLPPQEREKVLSKLSECINSIAEGRFELWNKIREILSSHRSFSDAEWALPEQELKELEKLYNKLEPDDIVKRSLWLFDDYFPELPEGKKLKDYNELEQVVWQKRKEAVQSIWNSLEIDSIINLATQTKNPQFVGIALAEISLTDKEEKTLFSLLDTNDQKKISFVQAYIFQKVLKEGDIYINKVVNDALNMNWSNQKIINLFLGFPQSRKVWDLLKNFDRSIQQKYWENLSPRFFDLTKEDILYGLKELTNVKRYFTALDVAATVGEKIPSKYIAKLLEKAVLEKSIDNINIISSWDIEELFKFLDQSKEIGNDEIAKLEWLYLPILAGMGSSRPPKALHQELANNPEFFCDVIRCVYKPKNKDFDEDEKNIPEELRQQRALLAFELLYTWKTVPGSDDTGKINYQKLKDWVNKAREVSKKYDRLEVCDSRIGQVFAYAVPDMNGNWPPEEICRIIEEVKSKELDDGFMIEIYNKRGVVVRSPFEGGKQELTLAEKYKEYSNKLANKYPRVSAILRKVAEGYENEAKRWDTESEKRKLDW